MYSSTLKSVVEYLNIGTRVRVTILSNPLLKVIFAITGLILSVIQENIIVIYSMHRLPTIPPETR